MIELQSSQLFANTLQHHSHWILVEVSSVETEFSQIVEPLQSPDLTQHLTVVEESHLKMIKVLEKLREFSIKV